MINIDLPRLRKKFEEAAAATGGAITALGHLKKVNFPKGQKILIYGASGSIGTFAVQLAKYFGAEVTGVCSTANLEMVKSIGADRVIDYTKEDFTKSGKYDVVFDAVHKTSRLRCKKALKKNGIFLSAHGSIPRLGTDDLIYIGKLLGEGKIKAVIDRRYPFEQIPKAHKYVESWRKKGNVIITLTHNN